MGQYLGCKPGTLFSSSLDQFSVNMFNNDIGNKEHAAVECHDTFMKYI